MLRSLRLLAVMSFVLFAACRDSGGSGDDQPDRDGGIDAPIVTGVRIQDVQSDTMVPGTPVALSGKIVTAIDTFGNRKGNFFIAEPGGGEFSGVLVFGAPLDQVALLAVGDIVDIVGAEKDEFTIETMEPIKTTTELVKVSGGEMVVTKTGTGGAVPAPHVLDALAIGLMTEEARFAEYEKWEGVLVTVNNVSSTGAIRGIRSSTGPDDCTFREFKITGDLRVDSSLAAIPASLPGTKECDATTETPIAEPGDCLASVSGVMDYFFNYKILPRATADIMTGGTGCAAENTAALCSDQIDNDGNGRVDCADSGCAGIAACQVTTTVVDIQTGVIPVDSIATLSNVVVTAVSFNKKNLWVSDALQAAPNNGIYVFVGGSTAPALPANIVVGARVNVVGRVDEFAGNDGGDTVTELTQPTVTFVSAAAGAPTPVTGVPITTLLDATGGEPYEGVLVELTNVRVNGPFVNMTDYQRPLLAGASSFLADDDILRLTSQGDSDCFAKMVGIWHYNAFTGSNAWVFLPRGEATDLVTGTSCAP